MRRRRSLNSVSGKLTENGRIAASAGVAAALGIKRPAATIAAEVARSPRRVTIGVEDMPTSKVKVPSFPKTGKP
jgi:hypothetical protein